MEDNNKKMAKKDFYKTNFGLKILEKKLKRLTEQQSNLQHDTKTSNTIKRQHESIEGNSKKTKKDESLKDSESVEGKSKKMRKDESVKNSISDKENFIEVMYSDDITSNSNDMEFMKNKIAELVKLNHKLQADMKTSEIEKERLKNTNYRLQTEILDQFCEWKVSLQNLEKGEISKIESKLASGSKLPVAFVRSAENKIHLGEGIWIRKDTYDDISKGSKNASVFVKSLAVAVFTLETLQNSSVTGKISAKKKASGEKARPPLDRKSVSAIKMTLRDWMGKKKYDEAVIDLQCNSVGTYLSHKIDDLKRKSKNASTEPEKIEMTVDDPDDVSDIDIDENVQTSTAREQDTENTEMMSNYNDEENAKSNGDSDHNEAEKTKDSDVTAENENAEDNESSKKEDENTKDNEN